MSNINDFVIGESPVLKKIKRYQRWRFFIKIKQKIQLWWLELNDKIDIMWKIRSFFRKIKNLWRWFPVIWKDEDWDQHYIYEILKFKLKNQAKYIGNRDFHTRAKRDAELMNLCVRLIDKIQEEYYMMESFDYEESKFNFIPIKGTTSSKLEIEHISDNLNDYFNKYPLIYKEVVSQHIHKNPDKHRIAMLIGLHNHERAHKLLFKIIEQNIQGWWD